MLSYSKRQELDSLDISEPYGLSGLIEEVFGKDQQSYGAAIDNLTAPLFIYKEKVVRDDRGLLTRDSRIEYHIANNDGNATMHVSVYRDVLQFMGDSVDDGQRGDILIAFCKIDFILNILLLYANGIYSGQVTYESFNSKMMEKEGSSFHSFANKKKYAKLKKLIERDTNDYLSKAQKIRNHIAHQYFLDNSKGLLPNEIMRYGNPAEAVEFIFNKAWLCLVRDYNALQVEILKSVRALK